MTTAPASAETEPRSRARHRRRPWSLQMRLMVTVTGIVALILVIVGIATSAFVGQSLMLNLDAKLRDAGNQAAQALLAPGTESSTAFETLTNARRAQPGFLLIVQSSMGIDGAYVTRGGTVQALTADQVSQLLQSATSSALITTNVDGIGSYRVGSDTFAGRYAIVAGLPLTEVSSQIAQIASTVALVTLGGLVVLGIAIAIVIRLSLRPLRAVADTATRVASLPLSEGAVSIAERVPNAGADDRTEIGRVGAALNTLLDHIDESLDARQRNEERMRSFVADASHELRTPLASIRGYSELSLRDPTLSENTETSLERIQAQSLRMTRLVEDLLLLARLDEGQELVYGTVDLTRLAIESFGDARTADADHRWSLDVGDESVQIAGDEARLHQVAANLLANARTHTPAGTHITVSVVRDDGDAVLRVHDDGPGVDPDIADELFERFSRADRSRARKTGGTGLGLSIARAIVSAHRGSITVDSVPGDTTFTVRLPLVASSTPDVEA